MSVRNPNTLASTIYDKLHLEINKKEIIEKWFIRIITLEFLNAKQIKPFILNDYKKEEIINLCNLQNGLMPGIFNDDLKELIDNYPNDFYDSKIIEILTLNYWVKFKKTIVIMSALLFLHRLIEILMLK